MMYIIMSNDGVSEFSPVMQTALAQVLMNVTTAATQLIITQADISESDIVRDEESGDIKIVGLDPLTDFKHNTLVYELTPTNVEAIEHLGKLADSAMLMRDSTMLDILSHVLKPNSNELDFDSHLNQVV